MTRTYVIEEGNTIKAYDGTRPAGFGTFDEFGERTASWSGRDLVDHYNALAQSMGKPVVERFMNRHAGRKRLWTLLQDIAVTSTESTASPGTSKKAIVLGLVQGERGATLEELMNATGWQAHSVRGFLSTQRRHYEITLREREENIKAYDATPTRT